MRLFRRFSLSFGLALLLAGSAWAQSPATDAAKPGALSQEQKLQVENYAKDVKLAEQQAELLRVQMAATVAAGQRAAQNFSAYITQLRTQLNAPVDKFDFDGSTLSFVPKGSKSGAAAATAAKPGSTPAKPDAKKPGGGQ